jgi:hypothetical protein
LVWDANVPGFSKSKNVSDNVCQHFGFPQWEEIPVGVDSHKPSTKRKEKKRERRMCKLVITESGLRWGRDM